jgi:hypothetical protein
VGGGGGGGEGGGGGRELRGSGAGSPRHRRGGSLLGSRAAAPGPVERPAHARRPRPPPPCPPKPCSNIGPLAAGAHALELSRAAGLRPGRVAPELLAAAAPHELEALQKVRPPGPRAARPGACLAPHPPARFSVSTCAPGPSARLGPATSNPAPAPAPRPSAPPPRHQAADEECDGYVQVAFATIAGINSETRPGPAAGAGRRRPLLRGAARRALLRGGVPARRLARWNGPCGAAHPPPQPNPPTHPPPHRPHPPPPPTLPSVYDIYADVCSPDPPPDAPVAAANGAAAAAPGGGAAKAPAARGRYRGALLGHAPGVPARAAGGPTAAARGAGMGYPQPGRVPRYDPCIDNKVEVYLNKPEVRARGWFEGPEWGAF